jgi:hypothetical protein
VHAFFGALGGRAEGSPWGDACFGACKPVLLLSTVREEQIQRRKKEERKEKEKGRKESWRNFQT